MTNQLRDNLMALAEGGAYLLALLAGTIAVLLRWITVPQATILSLILLTSLLLVSWRRLDFGRHPCFLFLGMLIVFQCGRLIGYIGGVTPDPFRIQLATATPFDVGKTPAFLTMLVITLSAICVYMPCRWNVQRIQLHPGREQSWLAAAYIVFFTTLPFEIYKNLVYFNYVRSHGGYLVVFTDNAAVLETAGPVVRAISLLAFSSFFLVFLIERNRKRLLFVSLVFVGVSTIELLIGFRGKFFLLIITLWFLSNLKTGKRFRLPLLLAAGILISVLATLAGSFREKHEVAVISPAGFLAFQGTSMQVTESVIAFPETFRNHAVDYVANDLRTMVVSSLSLPQGALLDNDVSIFLNPESFKMGYATGSAYLAQLYLLGGVFGVIAGSVLIGFVLRWLHAASGNFWGALAMSILLPLLIYLPRSGLLIPAALGIKALLSFVIILPVMLLLKVGLDALAAPVMVRGGELRHSRDE